MKYTVTVTLTKTYEVPMNAIDPADAIEAMSEWMEEDLEEYKTDTLWQMEAK